MKGIVVPINETELQVSSKMYRHLTNCRDPYYRVSCISAYLDRWNIKTVVVGVSGGVDSALVLAMLSIIPGITVHAVTIDFEDYDKVFDDSYVQELIDAFADRENIVWHVPDLSKSFDHTLSSLGIRRTTNAVRANVSYAMRYLAFFAYAQHYDGVTIGTTNKDEMGYAGWFGKNSDMVVDLHPISDLHKFEVTAWARLLGVPERIADRIPTGDLIDGTSDEENFGCTYDELSYFTFLMENKVKINEFMENRFEKLIALHKKNAHKYQGQKFNPVFIAG